MPTNCYFEFTRAAQIYYSGEQICGSIHLTTTQTKLPVESITLTLVGFGRASWTEKTKSMQIAYDDCTITEHDGNEVQYNGYEEYYREMHTLSASTALQPNSTHSYTFCYDMPESCPATCRQTYGVIVYKLEAVLQRAATFNKTFAREIVIRNRLDLNALAPQALLNERQLVCSSNRNKPNNGYALSVPCTGYVPGQCIQYSLEFDNIFMRNRAIVNLCQRVIYKCSTPQPKTKVLSSCLCTHKYDSKLAHTPRLQSDVLRIPLAIPISSSAQAKTLLQVSYYLEAYFLHGKHDVVQHLSIPLTIGTDALRATTPISVEEQRQSLFCYDNFAAVIDHNEET